MNLMEKKGDDMATLKAQIGEKGAALKLVKPTSAGNMSKEEMEMAAYFHWLGRGCPSDDSLTDWIEVEKKYGNEAVSKKMDVQA